MRSTASLTVLLAAVALVAAQPKTDPLANEKKELVRLEAAYKAAKAKSTKSPKDTAAKNVYSKATSDYGTAVMRAMSLKDRAGKYAKALNLFREALRANPDNGEAKANKEMIESIYKSLGKPIPK